MPARPATIIRGCISSMLLPATSSGARYARSSVIRWLGKSMATTICRVASVTPGRGALKYPPAAIELGNAAAETEACRTAPSWSIASRCTASSALRLERKYRGRSSPGLRSKRSSTRSESIENFRSSQNHRSAAEAMVMTLSEMRPDAQQELRMLLESAAWVDPTPRCVSINRSRNTANTRLRNPPPSMRLWYNQTLSIPLSFAKKAPVIGSARLVEMPRSSNNA